MNGTRINLQIIHNYVYYTCNALALSFIVARGWLVVGATISQWFLRAGSLLIVVIIIRESATATTAI
jgi:hypothetical protein